MATGHTAIVTGANHGIGAATAHALAQRGCAVLCTFLRVDDPDDPGTPQEYRDHRAQDAAAVVGRIRDGGGKAAAVEADLSDPATPGSCSMPPRSSSGRSTSWSTTRPGGWPIPSPPPRRTGSAGRCSPSPRPPGTGSSPSTRGHRLACPWREAPPPPHARNHRSHETARTVEESAADVRRTAPDPIRPIRSPS